jgi:hypothetical protein
MTALSTLLTVLVLLFAASPWLRPWLRRRLGWQADQVRMKALNADPSADDPTLDFIIFLVLLFLLT